MKTNKESEIKNALRQKAEALLKGKAATGDAVLDITEGEKMERELKSSKALLQSIIEGTLDAVYVKDTQGRYLLFNKGAEKFIGKKAEEVLGKDDYFLFPAPQASVVMEGDLQVMKGGKTISYEEQVTDSNGQLTTFLSSKGPVFDKDNNVTGLFGIARDITERKKLEEKFLFISKAVESSNNAIGISNEKGHHFYQNKALSDLFGYATAEELEAAGGGSAVVYNPELAKEMFANILRGESWIGELEMVTKSGHVFWAFERADAIKDSQGNIIGLIGIITDISELKLTEEKLKESEARLADIVFSMGDWVWEVDEQGRYTFSSEKASKILGYAAEEILGKTPFDFMPADEAQRVATIFSEIAMHKKPIIDLENLNISKTGEKIYLLTNGVPILDKEGNLKGYRGVDKDITSRKNLEESRNQRLVEIEQNRKTLLSILEDQKEIERKLRESEKHYRSLFENSGDGILYLSSNLEIVSLNDSYAKMHGYTMEEMRKLKLQDIVVEDLSKIVQDGGNRIMSGETLRFEAKHIHKDGHIIECAVSTFVISTPTDHMIVAFHRDITERNKIAQELANAYEQLVKLYGHQNEIKENERTRISREIHDELGQLLSALKIDLGRTKEQVENKSEVIKKLNSMILMADQTIKAVQRISSDLRPGLIDDLGLIPTLEWYCQEFEKRTSIRSHFKSDDVEFMDANRNIVLYRILQESLTNVMRHSEAKNVFVNLRKEDHSVLLEVIDDGIGMNPEKANDRNSLGFIGMRERIKPYKGNLMISSTPNKETKLSIEIPNT